MNNMPFSVLMSIYHKEKPEYFEQCMQSIWDAQTVKPSEIVLVQDGPLNQALYQLIDFWQNKLGQIFKTVALDKNVGLGDALNIGLHECSYELIARMDTDDLAFSDRFEKQLLIFQNYDVDVCSSWVSEFEHDEDKIVSYRKVPENHNEILKYFKTRNAINHPSVMYKKTVVEKAGGYQKMMWFEDYFLWIKMVQNGAKFYNIQNPLVNMRAGYGQLQRRSGLNYAIAEVKFLYEIRKLKFLNLSQFIKNVSIRFTTRLLPKSFLKYIYKLTRGKLFFNNY